MPTQGLNHSNRRLCFTVEGTGNPGLPTVQSVGEHGAYLPFTAVGLGHHSLAPSPVTRGCLPSPETACAPLSFVPLIHQLGGAIEPGLELGAAFEIAAPPAGRAM